MKKFISTSIFLLSIGLFSQNLTDTPNPAETGEYASAYYSTIEGAKVSVNKVSSDRDDFIKAADYNDIPTRQFVDLEGVDSGYYIIAGVYSKTRNATKQIRKLKKDDLYAASISHPESGLQYVFLEHHNNGMESVDATTILKSQHTDLEVWILEVTRSNVPTEAALTAPLVETYSMETISSETNKENKAINRKATPNQSKVIQKADYYFDKMWYADAAILYEQALEKDQRNYSYDIIQKAADAHYFNTNMEQAYHWYNLLYEKYKKDMSADNIFKYAHTLKGTGNYGRAKRLMRLYNRKVKDESFKIGEDATMEDAIPSEVVLDNILNTEKKFEIKSSAVNSEYSDFGPMFYEDGQVVFASAKDSSFFNTRRYKWNDQPYLDLYVAKMNEESEDLRDVVKMSNKINTKYHEASVTFSSDNSTMYFTRNNYGKKLKRDKNGINHLKIYISKKVDGEWKEGIELPFNSDDYSVGHPALSPDGKQLYFVSDMPGSIGNTDIFVVDVIGDGSFSEPRNLGPEINTDKREMFPFINNKKLYFSSDGHTGLGGLDVYEVAFDQEEGFLEVRNVGQPVNSNMDDFSYIVDEETQKGFFASNRPGGSGDDDIYSFKRLMVEEVIENAIAGVVTELVTGDIMPEALVMLLDENNIKLKEVMTDADGSFVFEDLDSNKKYTLKTVKNDYLNKELETATKVNEVVKVDVSMKKLSELITIEDGIRKLKTDLIFFDFDKSYIRNDASLELDKLVNTMMEYKDMVIKIESHTDSRGNNTYNKYLSDKRAKASRNYLIANGVAPERIESAMGYGEERLLNECDGSVRCTGESHQRNRRSEFIIVKM